MDVLEEFTCEALKYSLAECTRNQHFIFQQMYAHSKLINHVNEVVDLIPPHQLDWALKQVQNTVVINNKSKLRNETRRT